MLRHAKSSWDSGITNDHDRPLAKRGIRAARTMASFMASSGLLPDRIISSTATRCKETSEALLSHGELGKNGVDYEEELYLSSGENLVNRALQSQVGCPLLIAHEPGISDAVRLLCGARVRYPTGGLAVLVDEGGGWMLKGFFPPRLVESLSL